MVSENNQKLRTCQSACRGLPKTTKSRAHARGRKIALASFSEGDFESCVFLPPRLDSILRGRTKRHALTRPKFAHLPISRPGPSETLFSQVFVLLLYIRKTGKQSFGRDVLRQYMHRAKTLRKTSSGCLQTSSSMADLVPMDSFN